MTSIAETSSLDQQTRQWCLQAEQVQADRTDGCRCKDLVRQGILLRRRWDCLDPASPLRRRLLALLPSLQNLCHEQLAQDIDPNGRIDGQRIDSVLLQLSEDDHYLGDLLDDSNLSPQSQAFALECFRDDLYWLGTQVALLQGHRGIDLLGRILLEQEALQREIDAWEDDLPGSRVPTRLRNGANHTLGTLDDSTNGAAARPPASTTQRRRSLESAIAELQQSARRLRAAALGRQIQFLLGLPDPADWRGWYRLWQAAGHLEPRLGPAPSEADPEAPADQATEIPAHLRQALSQCRHRAAEQWLRTVRQLPPDQRQDAISHVVDDLGDATSETLTFLEELPLANGVLSLEILAQDIATARSATTASPVPQSDQPASATTNTSPFTQTGEGSGVRVSSTPSNPDNHRPTQESRAHAKSLDRSLRRSQALVAAELQDRHLAWRMEQLFGRRAVAAFERFILVLLVVFVLMLAIEGPLLQYEARNWSPGALFAQRSRIEPIFAWLDLGICLVFLAEFTLKLTLAQRRWLYFRRNFITGLLPAIPLGFAAYVVGQLAHANVVMVSEAADWFIVLRVLRYLRLPQMARWLEIARPALRMSRLIAFLLRASDRLVRQLSPLLNRNLLLFERAAITEEEPEYRTALAALRERFQYRAAEALHWLPRDAQCRLLQARVEDMTAMLSAPHIGAIAMGDSWDDAPSREIPVENLIGRLLTATPAGVSDRVSRPVARSVARWCRAFDVLALRRLPLVRDFVTAGRLPNPYDTTAQVANRIGLLLQQMLERVYWIADLYGTVTPPQLVDSVGDWLVRGTARPARRLLIFGFCFFLVSYAASLLPFAPLDALSRIMEHLLGTPLIILGLLCLIPMVLGTWFRQIANQATDFYSQVAEAQFIGATRTLKQSQAKRNHSMLHRRVLGPELAMAESDAARSAEPDTPVMARQQVQSATSAVEMLWRDYLDGPTFHRSDTGTTNQLLGNLVMISLRERRLAYGRRERARLRKLDLAGTRGSLRGPYLWFHFISRSLTHHTAKLVVDYNAFALPLLRAETASDRDLQHYFQWLSRRLERPLVPTDLPLPFRQRYNAASLHAEPTERSDKLQARQFHGNDFTALHFLSADPALHDDIRRRYGDPVADLMHRDRRDNIRRVFRTYPMHRWPQQQRTINLLTLYQRHMVGGLVLLVPFKLAWYALRLTGAGLRLMAGFIGEVLHPRVAETAQQEEADPYAVAVRKIHRMRKPLLLECLQMRARFDPEYLGVLLPGSSPYLRGGTAAPIEEDIASIGAQPTLKKRFRTLAAQRRRQVADLRDWLARFDLQGQSNESLRAVAIAYTIDFQQARSRLQATRQLQRHFEDLIAEQGLRSPLARLPEWSLRAAWCRWRYRGRLFQLFRQPAFAGYSPKQQRRCRRLVYCRRGGLLKALRLLTGPDAPSDPVDRARRSLAQVARDPAPWSRQLVVLRAVQTLSVLDLKTYCDLVYELGEYADVPTHYEKEVVPSP